LSAYSYTNQTFRTKKNKMEKMNKLEIIGVLLMAFGGLFWLTEEFYFME